MLARVTSTRISSGPGSGTSYSVNSMPAVFSSVTAALPFMLVPPAMDNDTTPGHLSPGRGGSRPTDVRRSMGRLGGGPCRIWQYSNRIPCRRPAARWGFCYAAHRYRLVDRNLSAGILARPDAALWPELLCYLA